MLKIKIFILLLNSSGLWEAYIISYTLGKKRYIGLEWSFLLCFGFSMFNGVALLFGLLIIYNVFASSCMEFNLKAKISLTHNFLGL
jgi:hypothetical protein